MICLSGVSFLACCLLMASWLPHNKFAVAAEPVSAVNENVGHEVRRLSSTKENLGGVISPKPVITPPKHIKCDATGLTAPSLNNGHVAPR